ncbi:Rhodanese-like protein [Rozella allomycis CSF55]|uniref:Rhodanese-like protein n=1 Tax=Rozella allomycis (strain CSF55) TaxID=988480 RepID=A0A4P9YBV8_ROZAC|nr:Rhodanese-like protein [Rozella allomycis CSF55]
MQYVTASDLANLIRKESGNPTKTYEIIDMRDDDYIDGKIVDSINIPSEEFTEEVATRLCEKLKNKSLVIFHCHLSQVKHELGFYKVRGPSAAKLYENIIKDEGRDIFMQKIAVLEGGFSKWRNLFEHDADLYQNI